MTLSSLVLRESQERVLVPLLGRRATAEGRSATDGISTANSCATVGNAGSGVVRS